MRPNRAGRIPASLIIAAVFLTLFAQVAIAGDRFGDSTATTSRISSNNALVLGKYLSAGNSGTLDSIRVWSRYNDTGTDTLVACIYSASGTLLGRSTDSVVVNNDVLNPYMLHFGNQNIAISASTRYWIGAQMRTSGTSTNTRIATASASDSLYLGTDPLPLESSIPAGSKYLGASMEAIRITAYYSARGNAVPGRRRRSGTRAEVNRGKEERNDANMCLVATDSDHGRLAGER